MLAISKADILNKEWNIKVCFTTFYKFSVTVYVKMVNKIRLLGMNDVQDFLFAIRNVDEKIELFNPKTGYRISAKSLLGVLMAASEWGENTWICSEKDIYSLIEKFIVIGDDSIAIHE